jgi:hypothetical protein
MKKSLKQILTLSVIICLLSLIFPLQSDGTGDLDGYKTKVNKNRNHSIEAEGGLEDNGGSLSLGLTTKTEISYYCKQRRNRQCSLLLVNKE